MLAQAVVRAGIKAVAAGMDPMELKRGIDLGVVSACESLTKMSKPCTDSNAIAQVGTISANSECSLLSIFSLSTIVIPPTFSNAVSLWDKHVRTRRGVVSLIYNSSNIL